MMLHPPVLVRPAPPPIGFEPHANDKAVPGDIRERVARNADTKRLPVDVRARMWIAEHPQVYALFVQFTLEAIASGRPRFGAKAVVERLRWETNVKGGDDFKLPNAHTAYLARKFVEDHPEHSGFFKIISRK